ncbi:MULTISPECIES: hypothetical protein [unclassified Bradyrhizobium]|uniref:hypothetical protein n=1 Tax=unclassified Bradyrhizobium TaxID=2631580 RepID=UPI001BAE143C|nr:MULTISPECIES: hypothetical protein [unclassified Bradyrhizobium]MBR1202465.1 hypothetical protein [Bradyrhizobium sp. AUGA SZCCT0124]MBR1310966.1 hypothetical protein [Bradyrhizobium sp. AUGA SZCCT0051]MBR1339414.1 hypothetical protein [Bradyrhizobium sp. AUGA SZCCT0105]MBR1353988.1 hypothetical protein [Bradyrhizobium sp. AUGA SZCCT0045]
MLALLSLPIELLRIAYYALQGLVDALRARNRLRCEFTVLINAPREAVWRFNIADRMVFDGPPIMEISREPVPDSADLWLTSATVNGQVRAQNVSRELERDEEKGIIRGRIVAHPLSIPPEGGRDTVAELTIEATSAGTKLIVSNELTPHVFRDRINYPIGLRRMANLIKQQCEKEAGTSNRLSTVGNNGWLLSIVALLSFWYLVGWKAALLLTVVVVLHEAGHAAAMLMAGVSVRGIYLVPCFGGMAVPKAAYRTEGRLGFIALMGPGLSLIPTLGLFAAYQATGQLYLGKLAELFAFVNASNLLPIYPLDGGLILNALVGSVNRRSALIVGWIGILIGIALAVYLQSLLIGIPFMLFALQRYLSGGRTMELERLTLHDGVMLAIASTATFALYMLVLKATWPLPAVRL